MEKEKFLGDKEVEAGTGVAVARVVLDFLAAWGLTPKTIGPNAIAFSIDTCTVNMGRDSGEKDCIGLYTKSDLQGAKELCIHHL